MLAWGIAAVVAIAALCGAFWAGVVFQSHVFIRMIRDGDWDDAVEISRRKRERDVPAR